MLQRIFNVRGDLCRVRLDTNVLRMSLETDTISMEQAAASARRNIAQAVNSHLREAGIAQRTVAEQIDVPMTSFVRRITGRHPFDIDQLAKIAALLDVSVAALITNAEHTEAVVA